MRPYQATAKRITMAFVYPTISRRRIFARGYSAGSYNIELNHERSRKLTALTNIDD